MIYLLVIVGALVVIGAAASIWGAVDDKRDLATGNPSLSTIVSYTGRFEPTWIEQHIGRPDKEGRFAISEERSRQLTVAPWRRLFDSTMTDTLCAVAAVSAPFVWHFNQTIAIFLSLTSLLFLGVGYAWAGLTMYRAGLWE